MGGKGGGGSAPKPDPNIGYAALQQAAIGRELAQLGREELQYQRQRSDAFDPIYRDLLNAVVEESSINQERAADQWNQYREIFQPIENRMAQEALDYDNPDEVARREGLAAATVAKQFDVADGQLSRDMARMGVSPTSSLGAQGMRDQANARALARAGAVSQERNNTKLLGMSLRENAARFGRNQTSTGLAASAQALQGNQAAGGLMGQQMQVGMMPGQQAASMMGAGANQIGSSGNLLLNQYQTQVQDAQFRAQLDAQNQGGLGSLIGSIGGALIMSSERLKEDIRPVDDEKALGELEKVAVKDWKYKDGVEDGGEHTGPIAEDVQQAMGEEAAPGGIGLDLITMSGKHHSAIRALANREKKLAKRIDRLERAARKAGADVSPGGLPDELKGDISAGIVGLHTDGE